MIAHRWDRCAYTSDPEDRRNGFSNEDLGLRGSIEFFLRNKGHQEAEGWRPSFPWGHTLGSWAAGAEPLPGPQEGLGYRPLWGGGVRGPLRPGVAAVSGLWTALVHLLFF